MGRAGKKVALPAGEPHEMYDVATSLSHSLHFATRPSMRGAVERTEVGDSTRELVLYSTHRKLQALTIHTT